MSGVVLQCIKVGTVVVVVVVDDDDDDDDDDDEEEEEEEQSSIPVPSLICFLMSIISGEESAESCIWRRSIKRSKYEESGEESRSR